MERDTNLLEKTTLLITQEIYYQSNKNNTDVTINENAIEMFHHISMEYMQLIREEVVLMGLP